MCTSFGNRIVRYVKDNWCMLVHFAGRFAFWGTVAIGIVVGVVLVHRCGNVNPTVEDAHRWYEYLWKFILNNAPLVGIISSFIGIVVAWWLLHARFHITPTLALSNANSLKVQVCNDQYLAALTDIRVELDFIRYINNGKDARTRNIETNRKDLTIIHSRLKGVTKCYYTIHTEGGFVWDSKYEYIRCRVAATNSITGVSRVNEYLLKEADIQYGVFKDDRFVPQSELYPAGDSKLWDGNIKQMNMCLHAMFESIFLAIEPVKTIDKDVMVARTKKAMVQIDRMCAEEMTNMFPSLKDEQETIEQLKYAIKKIDEFYNSGKKLNPTNQMRRDRWSEVCRKNAVYLAKQMDKDIDNQYKKRA